MRGIGNGLRRLWAVAALGLIALASVPSAATAQGQFAPVVRIDGDVITAYELSQRQAFLTLLRAPGDVRQLALDQLINETLQLREAAKAGIVPSDDDIKSGMDEFAARGNLTGEQFLDLLAQGGIAAATFRDFVAAGITWRDYVKATYLSKVSISQADIDAAMAVTVAEPGLRVLLSEIILPAGDAATRKASRTRAERLTGLDEAAFGDAAMRFSVGLSRNNLGRMKWLDVTALPPNVGAAVRGLEPGQTTGVLEVEDGLRVYFMRDREEVPGGTPATAVDYAALLLAGGQSSANADEVAQIRNRVTSCDDLYPIARGLPPEQLVRETVPQSQVPASYAAELERLDPGEISSRLTSSSGAMVVLMLCSRGNEQPRSLTRDMVAEQLRNRRAATMGQFFLEEQRANAHIEILGN